MRKKLSLGIIAAILLFAPAASGLVQLTLPKSQKVDIKQPTFNQADDVYIESNQMYYDSTKKLATAVGKVEILKGDNVLFADYVTYDQTNNQITAIGNVVTVGADGNAIFSDKMVMHDDFSKGVADYFRVHLSDGSLLAAATARRQSETKLVLHKAVYSPCPICAATAEAQGTAPQWQIKAQKVTVDNAEQQVTYHDATFELYGLPVMYTPYFAHGTPNANRESGFLTPTLRGDSNLGPAITTPYYYTIKPNMDLTLEPVFTSREGPVAAAEFRHLTPYGEYEFFGSYTRPTDTSEVDDANNDVKHWRGHLKGDGKFDLTNDWTAGFDGEVSSDDTYLKRYNYSRQDLPDSQAYSQDLLTSKVYLERIDNRDYSTIQAVHFQSLLEGADAKSIPNALPYVQNHFESKKGIIPSLEGSVLWTDISGFSIVRGTGDDNQRASDTVGMTVPYLTKNGQIFTFETTIRGDQYHMDDPGFANNESRLIPQASAEWRFPLMNQVTNSGKFLLEPIAKVVISPNVNYNKNVVNEDSQDIEFSDLNVFEDNRYRGLDQVESGARLYYGVRGGYYEDKYNITYLLGEDYRLNKPHDQIPVNSGIENNLSDYVGRVTASFYDKLDVSYKFRYDQKSLKPRRNEVDVDLNMKPIKLTVTYFDLDYDFTDPTSKRSEVDGLAQIYVADQWSVIFGGARNLSTNQNIEARGGVLYEGDCTNILTTVKHNFLSDRDAKSGVSVTLQLGLKNIGTL